MRRLSLVLVCAALLSAGVARAAVVREDRGLIVQVQPPRFAIRELDGTRATFRVNRATVITLNGRKVRLRRLRRGDVVTVDHVGRLATEVAGIRP
jgi:hypothetical protein